MSDHHVSAFFARLATATAAVAGKWYTFMAAVCLVLAWLVAGFWVGFTDQIYQLWINTITTILTFLVVFLIQNSQNRDTLAIQTKLDALIKVSAAPNNLMGVEQQDEDRIRALRSGR